MRSSTAVVLLLAWPVLSHAQSEPESAACDVVAGAPEVNAAGELVRPAPTDNDCARALTLEAKFLATSPHDFRLVRNMSRLPDPVQGYISGIEGLEERRSPVHVQVGRTTQQQAAIAIWLGTELVVIAYRVSDLSGSSTTVVLADLDSFTECAYLRWRGGALPGTLSIDEIQAELDRGRLGEREAPACHLRTLPLD